MASLQNWGGPATGAPVSARSIIDHTDQRGPVTVTINDADQGGPAPTDIDEMEVEVESGLGGATSRSWSGELTLFHPWRSHTLKELSEDCISHWTERQHDQSPPPLAAPQLLAALGSLALPGTGPPREHPATAAGARASRLRSR